MYPVLFEFSGFQIRSYRVIVASSFLLAPWMSARGAERKGLDPKLVLQTDANARDGLRRDRQTRPDSHRGS
jgi:prolipoprotein diacylglyceryltransferase